MSGQSEQSSDGSLDEILSSIRRIISDDVERAAPPLGLQGNLPAPKENGTEGPIPQVAPHGVASPDASQPIHQGQVTAPPPKQVLHKAVQPTTPNAVDVEPRFGAARRSLLEGLARYERASEGGLETPDPATSPANPSTPGNGVASARLEEPIVLPTETQDTGTEAPLNGSAEVMDLTDHMASAETNEAALPVENAPTGNPVETPPAPGSSVAPTLNGHAGSTDSQHIQTNQSEPVAETTAETTPLPAPACATNPAQPTAAVNGVPSKVAESGASPEEVATTASTSSSTDSVAPATTTSLEHTVTELLKPMLREWLDQNMPRLIEEALREDVGQKRTP